MGVFKAQQLTGGRLPAQPKLQAAADAGILPVGPASPVHRSLHLLPARRPATSHTAQRAVSARGPRPRLAPAPFPPLLGRVDQREQGPEESALLHLRQPHQLQNQESCNEPQDVSTGPGPWRGARTFSATAKANQARVQTGTGPAGAHPGNRCLCSSGTRWRKGQRRNLGAFPAAGLIPSSRPAAQRQRGGVREEQPAGRKQLSAFEGNCRLSYRMLHLEHLFPVHPLRRGWPDMTPSISFCFFRITDT